MWGLGTATLDKAVTVKLTRTLAIIPITLVLALIQTKKGCREQGKGVSLKAIFPFFILYFIAACLITTIAVHFGVAASFFAPLKTLSKFLIVVAMAAIGLKTPPAGPMLLGRDHGHQSAGTAFSGDLVSDLPMNFYII